jgi:hypothetical protein
MESNTNLINLPDEMIPKNSDIDRFIAKCSADFRNEQGCIYWLPMFDMDKVSGKFERNIIDQLQRQKKKKKRIRPRFRLNDKEFAVKKLMYAWFNGVRIRDTMRLYNKCERRQCINPRHLATKEDTSYYNLIVDKESKDFPNIKNKSDCCKPIESDILKVIEQKNFEGKDINKILSTLLTNVKTEKSKHR